MVAAIQITTLHEEQKFSSLIKEVVSPKLLWREMLRNIDAFTSATEFDGGCCIEPLAKVDWGEEDFKINGPMACAQAFRKIRNALSHGRDIRTGAVITPTAQNFEKLQPWVSLISIAAGEVIVYKGAL